MGLKPKNLHNFLDHYYAFSTKPIYFGPQIKNGYSIQLVAILI